MVDAHSIPALGNTAQQKTRLKTAIVADYYPYTFANKEGNPDGFSVDLAKAVTQVMGMDLEIRIETWEHARKQLETGEIDFLPMMAYSAERDRVFDFTAPHTIAYDAFFTRKDNGRLTTIADLKGLTVIVMKHDQAHDYLRSSGLVDSEHLILIDGLPEALRLLSSGQGDAALMPKLIGLTVMKELTLTNLTQSPVVVESYNRPFSFAVKEGNQLLVERLGQGLAIIKNTGQYREIYDKWFGAVEPKELTLKSVSNYIAGLLLVLLLVGGGFAVWSFSLRKQVAWRTKKLADEIVERKQAEQALKASEARFRRLAENARDVIYRMSLPDGLYEYMSPAVSEITGYTPEEFYRSPQLIYQLIHPDWQSYFEEQWSRLQRGEMPPTYEYAIIHKSGDVRWVNQRNILVRDDKGCIVAIEAIATDITERKHAEEEIRRLYQELEQRVFDRTAQLEAANIELESFAYSISHDLRAPLRHIDGFLELLKRKIATSLDEESHHYMSNISNAAKRMGTLVDDLLSFSRMGRHEISKMQVDLASLSQEVIQESEADCQDRTIDWCIDSLPVVSGDRAMLRIVLVNLVSNALKFTRTRRTAKIEIGCLPSKDAETIVFVRDNGVGFDMNYAGKLFGVFQRLHRVEDFEGTGIGLANVRRIIARHGGRTWAESQVEQGATLYFSLPSVSGRGNTDENKESSRVSNL
ncbi:MAG: transporter substrate-binding domain-containing protein [Chloroflexi bacterium]|nr:transporter substrate-binding domain-containing protein [Chloroflexota bacterium]